jgi:hypothetical protein
MVRACVAFLIVVTLSFAVRAFLRGFVHLLMRSGTSFFENLVNSVAVYSPTFCGRNEPGCLRFDAKKSRAILIEALQRMHSTNICWFLTLCTKRAQLPIHAISRRKKGGANCPLARVRMPLIVAVMMLTTTSFWLISPPGGGVSL